MQTGNGMNAILPDHSHSTTNPRPTPTNIFLHERSRMNRLPATTILRLPNEILQEIETHIERFQDLNALSRTSHFFHALLDTRLYDRILDADQDILDATINAVLANHRIDALRSLLDHGLPVQIEIGDYYFDSMLHLLSWPPNEVRQIPLARLLIERGADLEARDVEGCTPLHKAAEENNVGVARILLVHGANANAVNNDGNTPLHLVCGRSRLEDGTLIELLLAHGANIDAPDPEGNTPLLLADSGTYRVVFTTLLAHGADVCVQNNGGRTPLHLAGLWFQRDDQDLAEALLAGGADITAVNHIGGMSGPVGTPLHVAFHPTGQFMTEFLLKNGADVNDTSDNGRCPIQTVIEDTSGFWDKKGKWKPLVAMMIEYGADLGMLPRDYREGLEAWMAEIEEGVEETEC
jgi:ankyrin repeat protein